MRTTFLSRFILLAFLVVLGGCESSGSGGDSARIRVINVSPGYDSLDLYATDEEDDDDTDTLTVEAVAYETVSEFATLDSGTYSLEFRRSGVSGTLQSLTGQSLTDDSHTTYVAYGSSGNFNVLSIGEDVDAPDAGDTIVQVLNAAEGVGALDLYFTAADVSLENVSPDFSAAGTASGTLDSGTYRLRVTGTGDPDDMRLDIAEFTLDSEQVVSVILTATSGGVLVNAMVLPQQQDLSVLRNTKARVRGAIGISAGTMTSASIGGVTLLSNATAGAISNKYEQLEAGTVAVNLAVDGNAIAVPNQTLVAGGDYTLLAWNNDSGVQATLISDDNRLPTSNSEAKIRLINGMSGFGDPLNLAIDYSPLVEGVALGQASSFVEVDSGTDYQLDITSTSTTVNVLSKESITLQSAGVYTMFMAGGETGDEVSGILRKDR